jgi:type I restriction enzyme S subunit
LSELKRVNPPEGAEGTRTRVETGDVLVAITGIYLGKIALITEDVPEAYVNQHLALVRIDKARFDSRFISLMLTSPLAQHEVWRRNDGGTKPGMTLSNCLKTSSHNRDLH